MSAAVGDGSTESPDPARGRYAAIDLGSNSFHMVVARVEDGHPQLLDRLREPVRLASGLKDDGSLSSSVQRRALAALERFGERIRHLPRTNVRAVGTNALRHASRGDAFRREAERVLGVPIEIISGQEEARLIHLGVMRTAHPPGERCLVLDIGGGSTEVILGTPERIESAHSLEMGCVAYTKRYFPEGRHGAKALRRAERAARLLLEPLQERYHEGWDHPLGASGTIRAAHGFAQERGWVDAEALTAEALARILETLASGGDAASLVRLGVSASRAEVFPAGVAILGALFDALALPHITPTEGALREGVLHDLLGRLEHHDAREATVARLEQRYAVDTVHAARVHATVLRLIEKTFGSWSLPGDMARRFLGWAARLHEIGLAIAHDGHQRHGAYLLRHAHLPGFGREEQALLALLVGAHRGSLKEGTLDAVPPRLRDVARRLLALLRVATCLHRNRSPAPIPHLGVQADGDALEMRMPDGWLEAHPLTRQHLRREVTRLRALDIRLQIG
jgi:exopolyphosphatase/guanosine-5'-triphosphate,3'-diphosphate pyrophosphatase